MLRLLSILLVALRVAAQAAARVPFRAALSVTLLAALLSACSATPTQEAPPDPLVLVNEAVTNMRAAKTFRIGVTQAGPDYQIFTEFATVYFRQATAQYVAPGTMQATIRVLAAGLPVDIQVFSSGADQWYRAIWTGNQWVNQQFAPGFNPQTLIAEDTGFQAALQAMLELKYAGVETLENGVETFHLTASANGPDMAPLFGGLISPIGTVEVDAFIDRATRSPARFLVTEHESPSAVTPEAGQEAEPIIWTIDLYDINAPSAITTPEAFAEATAEAGNLLSALTAEASAEVTPDATPESAS